MARQRSYGGLLREARERRGFDLTTVSHRLRVRPDILRAIEEADFAYLPPRGYTRNMISAYARLVGLNPTEVTSLYLDEVHAYESGYARIDARRAEGQSRRARGEGHGRTSARSAGAARPPREGRGAP
ncbi:helix-turn-helix transcriptional regulator, partial [Adlercreutzia sp. ZJ473]|uniref:helix-turn-helix domain-containing protein n=1 Tax=Adlercreutzia sp. ZJ473 TaxID=2722822 RepID=UPI0015546EA2